MKNWLKKQATEFTAWIGFFLCLSVFITPDWVSFLLGIVLISVDDLKAKEFVNKAAPWAGKFIDDFFNGEGR